MAKIDIIRERRYLFDDGPPKLPSGNPNGEKKPDLVSTLFAWFLFICLALGMIEWMVKHW